MSMLKEHFNNHESFSNIKFVSPAPLLFVIMVTMGVIEETELTHIT